MRKNYEIITKKNCYDSVIIQEFGQLLEVSCHLDNSKRPLQIKEINYRIMNHINDSLARWTSQPDNYVSKESIKKAIATIKRMIADQKRYIKGSVLHSAYDEMSTIAKNKIEHYASDFYTHDKIQMGKDYYNPFIWLVRITGSWMIKNQSDFNTAIIAQEVKENQSDIYFYNGSKLTKIIRQDLNTYYSKLTK